MKFIFRWLICFPLISLLMVAVTGLLAAVMVPPLILLGFDGWTIYAWATYWSAVILGAYLALKLAQYEKDIDNGGTH